jgi:hypothetical protein
MAPVKIVVVLVVLLIDASHAVENPLLGDGFLSFIIMFCFPLFNSTLQQIVFIGATARYWSVASSMKPLHPCLLQQVNFLAVLYALTPYTAVITVYSIP